LPLWVVPSLSSGPPPFRLGGFLVRGMLLSFCCRDFWGTAWTVDLGGNDACRSGLARRVHRMSIRNLLPGLELAVNLVAAVALTGT
jgi:hypothetical protein